MSVTLAWTDLPVAEYGRDVQPLALLLDPATVALAVPLHRSLPRIRQAIGPVSVAVFAGAVVGSASAVAISAALGAHSLLLRAIAPKSATAAIAMAVARELGGDPALAVGLMVLTGVFEAVICTSLLDLLRVRDPRARAGDRRCRAWHRHCANAGSGRRSRRLRRPRHGPHGTYDRVALPILASWLGLLR